VVNPPAKTGRIQLLNSFVWHHGYWHLAVNLMSQKTEVLATISNLSRPLRLTPQGLFQLTSVNFFFNSISKRLCPKLDSKSFKIGEAVYTGRILLNVGQAPKLGDCVTVSAVRTGFHLTEDQIAAWLLKYGKIEGTPKYRENPEVEGWVEDTLDVLMRLHKHIPSVLPAYGKKLQIRYKGQPVLCSKCLMQGHIRRNCTSTANNWMGYVKYIIETGAFSIQMFGSWYEYYTDHQAVLNSQTQQ